MTNTNNNSSGRLLSSLRSSAKDYPVFIPTCYREMIQTESAVLIGRGNVTSSGNSAQRRLYPDDPAAVKSSMAAASVTPPRQLQNTEGRSPRHAAGSETGSGGGGHACFNCYSSSGGGSSNVFPVAKSQDFAHLLVAPPAPRISHSNNTSGINPLKAWFSPKSKKQQQPPQPPQSHTSGDAHMEEVLKLKQEMGEMGKKLTMIESYYSLADPWKPSLATTLPPLQDFMHAVTEARVCVKQLCRRIQESSFITARREEDEGVREEACINLESLLNLAFYQDFENIQFQPSGAHPILDPHLRCQAYYKTFLIANNATCEELLSYKELSSSPTGLNYSHSFDLFCEQKMSLLQLELGWDGPWPDDMVEAFFTAARSVWLVHLLAFSFHPTASIFRVGGKEASAHSTTLGFDPKYMEDIIPPYKKNTKIFPRVGNVGIKVMVMPGFFVGDQIIKCKVLRQ